MRTLLFLIALLVFPLASWASLGLGINAGWDFSLRMPETSGRGDLVVLDSIEIFYNDIRLTEGILPIPVFVSRSDWSRYLVSLGGRLFATEIPVIDMIEFSANLSMWEYRGSITYPDTISPGRSLQQILENPTDPLNFVLTEQPVTLEAANMSYLGMNLTPFAKLQLDITVRKSLPDFGLENVSFFAGGGFSLSFATPMLSEKLVGEAIAKATGGDIDIANLRNELRADSVRRAILQEIIDRLANPATGLHLSASSIIRMPMIPLGFYADVKYLFALEAVDPDIDLGGSGFIIGAGIALTL